MDRSIIYSTEQIRLFDFLSQCRDLMIGMSRLAQALFGSTNTIVSGFSAAAQATPNMTVTLASGQIYQLAALDTTPYGPLAADSTQIYQQGYADQQILSFTTAGLSAGQEQWVLVQCKFDFLNQVRTGDPTGGVLPYYNSSNPTQPLQGPGGSGQVQETVRIGKAAVSLSYGPPAATNTAVPPNPSANNVPLYLIKLTFGQTAITNGQISKAGNAVYAGYQEAPFAGGLFAQHHKGVSFGQAPQIDLTTEVQGVLPLALVPATGTQGLLTCFRIGSGPPSGLSGASGQGDLYFQTSTQTLYVCETAGSPGTWKAIYAKPTLRPVTFPYTLTNNFANLLIDCTAGDVDVYLPTAANQCEIDILRVDTSANRARINVSNGSGEKILTTLDYFDMLSPNEARKFVSDSSTSPDTWWIY